MPDLQTELINLLTPYRAKQDNSPDTTLALYLLACLEAYNANIDRIQQETHDGELERQTEPVESDPGTSEA